MHTSTQRGAVAESMVCTWALKRGYIVSFPARGQSPEYDMIVDTLNGHRNRVQVKRAHVRVRGKYRQLRAGVKTKKGGYYDNVDAFAFVDVEGAHIWVVPAYQLTGMGSVTLNSPVFRKYQVQ